MNHVYRLKRSGRTQQLQPVPETARASGKGKRTAHTLAQAVGATLASVALSGIVSLAHAQQAPPAAQQLPQGGVVSRGSVGINTSTTPAGTALMTVNQASNRAVIDWASFNVGSQAKVQFNQPSSSAVVLNNILGHNASQIYGQISANGQVFLSNPNGVYFSPTAQVNVGGLVATTGRANADEFMAGKTAFSRAGSTGSVVNQGQLQAALGGYIALLAPEVRNQGVIVAQAGTVALASGEAVTLNFHNNATGLAGITTTPQAIAALIENRSAVRAEGGQIILSAHALAALQGSVFKNSGLLSATSLIEKGGKIVLMADSIELTGTSRIEANGAQGGGTVLVGGDWQGSGDVRQAVQVTMAQGASIEASATSQGDGGKVVLWSDVHNADSQTTVAGGISAQGRGANTTGGQIETSGARLRVADSASIRMGGEGATGGLWLLDPTDFTIAASGGDITGTALAASISAGNTVEVLSSSGAIGTAGNINVNDAVSWNNTGVLKLTAAGGVTGASAITMSGAAGTGLVLDQAGTSTYSGTIAGANATVTKQGAGMLTLSGANTYRSTVISQGTLRLGSTTALGTGTAGTVTLSSGATLDLNGQTITLSNAKALNISGSGVSGAGALINSSATAATYPGLLTLGANTYLNALSGNIVLSNTGTITGAGFNLTLGGAATGSSIAGIIGTGTGSVTKQDAGTWTLSGANTYTGGTHFNDGKLVSGSSSAFGSSGTLSFGGGTLVMGFSTDHSARLSSVANQVYRVDTGSLAVTWATSLNGTGASLIKSGTGALTLNASNSLSGGITVQQGSLIMGNAAGLGTGSVVVNAGAAIDLNGRTVTSANPLTLSGTGTATSGALLNTSSTAASFNGLISLAGHTTIGSTQLGALNLTNTGAITGAGYDLTYNGVFGSTTSTWASSLNTGSGRLIKTGSAKLVLSGTSNFTGGTSLSGGTLTISDDRNLGAVPATPTVNLTLAGGTLQFSGQPTDLVLSPNRSISLTGNATVQNASATAAATIAGAITGSANLSITGLGNSQNLALTGVNNLSGNTTISQSAKVVLGNTNALGSGSLSIDGATLDIGAYDQTVGAVTLSGSGVSQPGIFGNSGVLTGSSYTLTSSSNNSPLTLSARLGGSGALSATMTANSTVIVTLSGSNSFSGGITLNSGGTGGFLTLRLGSSNALGTGPVLVNSSTTLDLWGQTVTTGNALTLNGTGTGTAPNTIGALSNGSGTAGASFNGPITLGSASTISAVGGGRAIHLTHTGNLDNAGFDLTLSLANGSLAGSIVGGGGLIKSGSGTWVLTGNNNYTGATTINVGTLQIGNGGNTGALPAASAVAFGTQADSLNFNRADGATVTNTISSGVGATIRNVAYGSSLNLSGATLIGFTGTYTATLNEAVATPGAADMAAIELPASPTLSNYRLNINTSGYNPSFTAIPAFTWAGTSTGAPSTRVNGATPSATVLGEQLTRASNSLSIGSGATWSFLNQTSGTTTHFYTTTDSTNLAITGSGAAITLAAGASVAHSGVISTTGPNGLTVRGAGTLTLSGSNTYINTVISGAGTVLKAGSATAFGSGNITVTSGNALDLNGQTLSSTGVLSLSGTGVNNGGALMNSGAAATNGGLVSLAADSSIIAGTGAINLSNPGTLELTRALTLGGAAGGSIASIIGNTGTLIKADTGTWTLSGANTYTGATTVSAGVLKAGHANAFGPASGAGGITVSSGAALDLNGQAVTSTGALTLNGTGINNGGALMNSGAAASYAGLLALGSDSSIIGGSGTIALGNAGTINGSGRALTLGGAQGGSMAGIIGTGAGTLTKQDAGTWSLNGVNTFTGMVTVNAGTLQIATDRGLGAVPASAAVALTLNGGTLTANNSIDVTLNANRLIAIGSNGGSIVNAGTSASTLSLEGAIGGATVGSVTLGPLTITGGDIRIGANISMGAYDLLVKSTGNIFQGVATTNPTPANVVVSTQGAGHVTYWADSDASGAGAIQFRAGSSNTVRSSITTAGGNIVLGGGSGATAVDGWARGLYAVNLGSYSHLDAGTGSITLKGMTNATSWGGTGVLIDSNSTLNGDTIRITGNGNPTNTFSDFGVFLKGGTSVTASSLVNITGNGGGTASSAALANTGVRFDDVTVSATGAGNVVITGDGGGNAAGGTNYGIQLLGNSAGNRSSIMADTGTVTITGMEGASAGGIGISATVARIGAASQTGLITVRANSLLTGFLSTAANNSQVLSSGVVNMEPLLGSASFVGRGLDLTYIQFGGSISSLTLGKSGNTGAVIFGTLNTNGNIITGPITAYGGIQLVNDTASSTGITLNGSVLQTAGRLITPTLLLTGTGASNVSVANSGTYGNAIGTVAGSGLGTVNINNGGTLSTVAAGALTVGTVGGTRGLSASGPVTVTTYRGDITLADNIATSNAGTAAITLNAGQLMPIGDTTSGNLIFNNGVSLTTGSGGRALLYTGAVANAGLTTLVGSGSGRFRYGSTSSINNFTNWLGTSGFYAIYRERPTASWSSTASQTFDYGNTPVIDTTGSVSGLVNGDVADTNMTVRLASTNAVVAANTRGFYNVGSYVFSRTEAAKALGYQVSSPTLTVNRATLTVTANDFTKTYDGLKFTGGKGVTYSGFATGENATNALSGSVSYGGTAQNVVDASASTYSIIPSGLSASNYTINYVNGALTVNPATLTVRVNNDARFVSEGDAVGAYNGASYSGFVAKQTPAVLGGALTISRSSSGPDGNLAGANTQAGTYTGVLTGSGLTSTNYNINYVAGHYTIVPADQLLVKMANVSATYGSDPVYSVSSARYYRSSNSTVYDLTSSVVLAGNSFSLNDGAGGNTAFTLGAASPSLSTAGQLNAGAYQVGAASITNTSVNYNNTITVTGALQVNPRSVTAAVTSSVSKSYDGTPAMNGLTLALAGAVTGDAVSASGAGAYASKNAGNPVAYTVSNITLSGADARNYVLTDSVTTQASNTLSGSNGVITAVPLSITANNDSKLYDGNAYSGGNGVVFSGFVNNETGADLSGSLVYGGTSQGATNVGASYTIVPSGYTSTNYTIGYANATLSITPVGLTAIVGTLQGTVNKRYDGTDTATLAAENFLLTGWVSGEGATVTKTTGTYDDRNAGSGKTVTVSLSDSDYAANAGTNLGNYTLPNIISGAVGSISPRPVTVSNTSRSTTYDAVGTYASLASSTTVSATSASTAPSGTGLVGSDALGSVTQTPSGTGVTPTGVAQAGSFSVTPSAAVLSTGLVSNYDFSYAASTHTVDKANLAVTAKPSLSGNVYRGAAYTGSYTSNALGSDASAITVTGVATGTNAGTYSSSLAVSGAVLANYNTPVITDANLVISPRPVTVSNTSRSTTYDGATSYVSLASSTTVSATSATTAPSGTGLVGSDALGSVTQTPSGTGVTPTGVAQAGSFSVTPSAAVLSTGLVSNYDFSYAASTHTVNPADLVVTVTPISGALRGTVSKVYDATRVAILSSDHYLLTGWLGSDGATVTKTTGMYDSASAGTGKTVTVNLNDSDYTANAGTNLSNYRLPGTISGPVGVITKAPLTATGTSALVTYNGANQAVSGFTVSGLQGSDTVASLSTVVASGATGKNAGSYTNAVTVGTETNYSVTAVDGTMVIQKAPLMVRPNDDAKFVTQADVPGYAAASYSGWVGGESPAVLGGTLAIARSSRGPDSNPSGSNALAGSYTGVLTASGLSSGNYAITYQPGNYTVVPADQLLIRLANSSVGYGTAPAYSVQSAQYLKSSSNTVVDLTVNATLTGNTLSLDDGAGGLTGLMLGAASPALSGAGHLRAGGYQLAATQVTNTSSNYSNTVTVTGALQVNPTPLSVAWTAANKVYDGSTSAALSASDNRQPGDVLTLSATGQFADKNAGEGKRVSVAGVSLTGSDAGNYTVASSPNSPRANIARLPQVSWVGGNSGSWFDPANWAGGAVPDLANVAAVTIPAGVTVSFDNLPVAPAQAGAVLIDALGSAGSLAISAGSLSVGAGGIALNTLTQTGGALASAAGLTLGSLNQSGGSISAGSLSTTTGFSQGAAGTVAVLGAADIRSTTALVSTGALSVGGDLTLNNPAGQITQVPGTSLAVVGKLSMSSGGQISLGQTTVSQDARVVAQDADILQTDRVVVGGETTLDAGRGLVRLDNPGNDFVGPVTVRAQSSTVLGARTLLGKPEPPSTVMVPPSVKALQAAYQVTVMKAPEGSQAGLVHIELRSNVGEAFIDLPLAVQQWLRAAGPAALADLPEGLQVIELADRLALRVLPERLQTGDLVLRSSQGELTLRLVKALGRLAAGR